LLRQARCTRGFDREKNALFETRVKLVLLILVEEPWVRLVAALGERASEFDLGSVERLAFLFPRSEE
jgi:hypothetical protein